MFFWMNEKDVRCRKEQKAFKRCCTHHHRPPTAETLVNLMNNGPSHDQTVHEFCVGLAAVSFEQNSFAEEK